jgi:hypothetical protein
MPWYLTGGVQLQRGGCLFPASKGWRCQSGGSWAYSRCMSSCMGGKGYVLAPPKN